jgi:hypothetical protein
LLVPPIKLTFFMQLLGSINLCVRIFFYIHHSNEMPMCCCG